MPAARRLRLRDGRTLAYDRLLLATGSRVRTLDVPGRDAAPACITCARSPTSTASRRRLRAGARVLLVGAGYIGLEVAAVARQRGFDVTVLEAADRVMSRAVSVEVAAFLRSARIAPPASSIHCGAAVKALHGTTRVTAVETADGRIVPVRRRRSSASASCRTSSSRLPRVSTCSNGIVVDEFARTADPHIVRRRRLHEPSAAAARAARAARVRAERDSSSQSRGRDAARRAGRLLRGAVVLVGPIRLEAADRGVVDGLRRGRAARRSRDAQLRRVLPRRRASCSPSTRSTARRSSSRARSWWRTARASHPTCCATPSVDLTPLAG